MRELFEEFDLKLSRKFRFRGEGGVPERSSFKNFVATVYMSLKNASILSLRASVKKHWRFDFFNYGLKNDVQKSLRIQFSKINWRDSVRRVFESDSLWMFSIGVLETYGNVMFEECWQWLFWRVFERLFWKICCRHLSKTMLMIFERFCLKSFEIFWEIWCRHFVLKDCFWKWFWEIMPFKSFQWNFKQFIFNQFFNYFYMFSYVVFREFYVVFIWRLFENAVSKWISHVSKGVFLRGF